MESAISVKGQVTIPKEARDYLHLKPGDRVKFFIHPDGHVVILPKIPTATLKGMLAHRGKRPAPTIDEMDEAIATAAAGVSQRAKRR